MLLAEGCIFGDASIDKRLSIVFSLLSDTGDETLLLLLLRWWPWPVLLYFCAEAGTLDEAAACWLGDTPGDTFCGDKLCRESPGLTAKRVLGFICSWKE